MFLIFYPFLGYDVVKAGDWLFEHTISFLGRRGTQGGGEYF